jgi:hypothetical protein
VAWTPATFKARWIEFDPTADALVQAALDDAVQYNDERLLGDRYDHGVGLYAAHLLAIQQFGQPARLDPKVMAQGGAPTIYLDQWMRLAYAVAGGPWTLGVIP